MRFVILEKTKHVPLSCVIDIIQYLHINPYFNTTIKLARAETTKICENIPLLLLALCVRFIDTFVDPGKKRHRCFSEISKSVQFPVEDKQTSTYPTYLDRAVGKSTTDPDQQANGSHCWMLNFVLLKKISTVFRNCNHYIGGDD